MDRPRFVLNAGLVSFAAIRTFNRCEAVVWGIQRFHTIKLCNPLIDSLFGVCEGLNYNPNRIERSVAHARIRIRFMISSTSESCSDSDGIDVMQSSAEVQRV